jgi:sucrose-6-phosphate hydrolase SacC (GH32 family)
VNGYNTPATEGVRLFQRTGVPEQNVSGFEFCCGGFDTYQEHGFVDASGDFMKLDGGFWGAGIAGLIGERVFSSYGDGFDNDQDTTVQQLGGKATGSIKSPAFVITQKYINFLLGGGVNRFDTANATAVVLVVDDKVVRHASGDNQTAAMAWHSWDVADLAGKTGQIKFIDLHPADNSDQSVPYILADEFRQADKAAAQPVATDKVGAAAQLATNPLTAGKPAFTRLAEKGQNIAGFEFCCGQFNTYLKHEFQATGDFLKLDGGFWGADIANHVGERVFSSRADGFTGDGTALGWIGDAATGTLVSPTFVITEKYINFLVGGGTNPFDHQRATAMVLRVNGKIVRHTFGNGKADRVDWQSWDVTGLTGQKAVIEIIDRHDANSEDPALAFILVDEIRQSPSAAVQPAASSVVSTVDGHDQALKLDLGDPNPFYHNGSYYIYYLQNLGYHSWSVVKTDDLLTSSFPREVLSASGGANAADQWLGSGSVIEAQNGQLHLFYTGHNQNRTPVEVAMRAGSTGTDLYNWTAAPDEQFSGSSGYSNRDFRDPMVVWNEQQQNYSMLVTSRYNNQAAIGLYTSTDLKNWAPKAPLYLENSPLNLEVPDYFSLDGTPFIVYSDQRDESRQVKYLQQVNGVWTKPDFDAVDGRAFYAARTAGSADERLLFGWVPHTEGRLDGNKYSWGGDLMVHQVRQSAGKLQVELPQKLKQALATQVSIDTVWTKGNVSVQNEQLGLSAGSAFTLQKLAAKNRLSLSISSATNEAIFGIQLRKVNADQTEANVFIEINSVTGVVSYKTAPMGNNPAYPTVKMPLNVQQGVALEVLLDPLAGVGAVYINRNKALSFRLYGLADYDVGVYSQNEPVTVDGLTRHKQ